METLQPDWPAPARVKALVTTRALGDMAGEGRQRLRELLPAAPVWLKQVHGTKVIEIKPGTVTQEGDAAAARAPGLVCAVMIADCMPVFLTDESGTVAAAAHAGWRGLCAGVIEATFTAMKLKPADTLAWLGPAIGPRVYEVGDEVRTAFLARDPSAASAFTPTRPGHWLLDLYAIARQRLAKLGVEKIYGGDFCTYSDRERFFSYRRDHSRERIAALIWLT